MQEGRQSNERETNETGCIQGWGRDWSERKLFMFEIILNCPFDFSWPAHHLEVCYLVFRHRRIFYSNSFFRQWCPIDTDLHYQAQKVYVSAKHLPPSCKLFFVFFTSKINSDVSHPRPVSLLTWENNMCQCGEYQEKYGDARKGSHLSSSNVLLWWDLWRCSRRFIPNLAQLAFQTRENPLPCGGAISVNLAMVVSHWPGL